VSDTGLRSVSPGTGAALRLLAASVDAKAVAEIGTGTGVSGIHLLHGTESLFQSLGLRSEKWGGALRKIAIVFCAAYFFFNLTIPASVLLGRLKPHATSVVAAHAK